MFDKGDSICNLVRAGAEMDELIGELVKCQVMCVNCHMRVTQYERFFGFSELKKKWTRLINNNEMDDDERRNNMEIMTVKTRTIMDKI